MNPQISRLRKNCFAVIEGEDPEPACGTHALFFPGDALRYPESRDLAVILPELVEKFQGRFSLVLVDESAEKRLQAKFGFSAWPATVFIRDGKYLGALTGLCDWSEFVEKISLILDSKPARPVIRIVAN